MSLKRPFAAVPQNDAMGQFLPHAPAAKQPAFSPSKRCEAAKDLPIAP
jgi:hypothetical protein